MYSREIKKFIKKISEEIKDDNAAVFAGAGLSRPAGFVDWKNLMRDIADDIDLNIEKETDFVQIAQYYYNKNGRHGINQLLLDEFCRNVDLTDNHKVLSRLPIDTYWTTNYDGLIEESLRSEGKKVNIVNKPSDFKNSLRKSDVDLYKMHGDKNDPENIILIKDDYDKYNYTQNKLFSEKLIGDLLSKTFMFIGFSFNDPNIDYILSKIKVFIGEDTRKHYCFMKKVKRNDYNTGNSDNDEELYEYDAIKQRLKIDDLKRYKIEVLLVNEYIDITNILKDIYRIVKTRNVFISGSASVYDKWSEEDVLTMSKNISSQLIEERFNIVTGFGLGVGDSIISGALESLHKQNAMNSINERLFLRPFPQYIKNKDRRKEVWTEYRKDIISNAGIAIFIFGNKKDDAGNKVLADGMIEEFEIAIDNELIPIPVGATGDVAEELWKKTMENFDDYVGYDELKLSYEKLGDKSKSLAELSDVVIEICDRLVSIDI